MLYRADRSAGVGDKGGRAGESGEVDGGVAEVQREISGGGKAGTGLAGEAEKMEGGEDLQVLIWGRKYQK